jgi:predicted phosphodiesterase
MHDVIGLIADIHGNRWALGAVLDDMARRGLRAVVNLGDSLYGPLDPASTADLLMARPFTNIRGNQDRLLLQSSPVGETAPSWAFTRSRLSPHHFDWLGSLPPTAAVDGTCLCCHGTPRQDDAYLLEQVGCDGGVRPMGRRALESELQGFPFDVIACGHSHIPRLVVLPDGRRVVNPGSVGLPAYRDEEPFPHVMAAGSPHARYAILRRVGNSWDVEFVTVKYDWMAAARIAEANHRPDWAAWLATGQALPA